VPFVPEFRALWDGFVERSKNGTFLFKRDFVEYHSDRFVDASLLVFDGDTLLAVLPASRHRDQDGDEVRSHGGLTYGGLVCDHRMTASRMLEVMAVVVGHYREAGVGSLLYKPVPHIYHSMPAEEDLYALFREGAELVRRDVAAAIPKGAGAPLTKGRKWAVKQGRSNGIQVSESDEWHEFMAMETALLMGKYNTRPVHTADELERLHRRFPQRIRLFTASRESELLAGTVTFDCGKCVHVQYIASTERGRELCAGDVLFERLIAEVFCGSQWFDFGISTEDAGLILNSGLSNNKESWGARSVVYDQYRLRL